VFDSPGFGKAKILSGVRTSFVIPSNTLQSNQTYTARLRFFRLSHLDTRSLPGALVVAGHVAETRLPLQTAAASGPRITRVSYHPAQGMILAFRSESGAWYEVQWSSNFSRWELAGTVPGQSGETEYSDPQGLAAARRFYRVVKR
jgi:hypothetical protein